MNSQLKMFVLDLRALISRAPVVTLIFILAMGGQMAHAGVTATISGVVRDPSGAVIPGAQVIAKRLLLRIQRAVAIHGGAAAWPRPCSGGSTTRGWSSSEWE